MEERYWVRHPSLSSHVGPYRKEDLRAAIVGNSFPRDCEVRLDGDDDADWQAATAVLGMPSPAATPQTRTPEVAGDTKAALRQLLMGVRRASAYLAVRLLVNVLATITVIAFVILAIAGVSAGASLRSPAACATVVASATVQVCVTIILAGTIHAILDIADCALRRDAGSPGE